MGEHTIPCSTEHIETVADCEGSFVAWPKSLVGLGDPPVHTARHGDFSSSKSHPILGVRPTAPPSSPVQDVVDWSSYVSLGPRLLHDHMMEHDITTVGLLGPENMAYVVDFGDHQYLDRALETYHPGYLCRCIYRYRLGSYFGNGTYLSLRLDRIGLMFPEYPNK
ncbi:unnamed protein product [Cuscuta campestris]|uniref:Uncharacterized protein n=1 Tax=Cuscuta campestris TaxID=132261 RepID=A0A484L274_9ASTE|nr:unnamed protein product [Cuscuta campestris]